MLGKRVLASLIDGAFFSLALWAVVSVVGHDGDGPLLEFVAQGHLTAALVTIGFYVACGSWLGRGGFRGA